MGPPGSLGGWVWDPPGHSGGGFGAPRVTRGVGLGPPGSFGGHDCLLAALIATTGPCLKLLLGADWAEMSSRWAKVEVGSKIFFARRIFLLTRSLGYHLAVYSITPTPHPWGVWTAAGTQNAPGAYSGSRVRALRRQKKSLRRSASGMHAKEIRLSSKAPLNFLEKSLRNLPSKPHRFLTKSLLS